LMKQGKVFTGRFFPQWDIRKMEPDDVMDVDERFPESLLRGAFSENVNIVSRDWIRAYIGEISSTRRRDGQVEAVIKEFNAAADGAMVKPKSAVEVRRDVKRIMQDTKFCIMCGRQYTIADTIGNFACSREFNGPYGGQGRNLETKSCVHSDSLDLFGTEDIPVIMFLTNRLRIPNVRDVKSITVVTMQPSGAVDLTRTYVKVYRICEPHHF